MFHVKHAVIGAALGLVAVLGYLFWVAAKAWEDDMPRQ